MPMCMERLDIGICTCLCMALLLTLTDQSVWGFNCLKHVWCSYTGWVAIYRNWVFFIQNNLMIRILKFFVLYKNCN